MSLVLFAAGMILAFLDLVIDQVDILPDCAGFLLLLLGMIPLLTHKKLSIFYILCPILGLFCSFARLFVRTDSWALLLLLFQSCAGFLLIFFLARCMYPSRSKGSDDSLRFQSLLTAHFFLMITKLFAGFLGLIELLGILVLLFQTVILIYEVVTVCRHWPARPIY